MKCNIIIKPKICKNQKDVMDNIQILKNIKIFACSTACGKSWLCKIDQRFFDLDKFKSSVKKEPNHENICIDKMFEELKQGKIILNATHGEFIDFLHKNAIPYCLMYGNKNVVEEYIQRMRTRGSSEEFIERYSKPIAEFYEHYVLDERPTIKIEMSNDEYVSDYLWTIFGKKNI